MPSSVIMHPLFGIVTAKKVSGFRRTFEVLKTWIAGFVWVLSEILKTRFQKKKNVTQPLKHAVAPGGSSKPGLRNHLKKRATKTLCCCCCCCYKMASGAPARIP